MLLLVGFCFKVALVPFQMWTPDVYEGAPTPITALMSVGVKAAGFAALLRVLVVAFPTWQSTWGLVIAILAALSMTWGNLAAIRQGSVKRMLAYSSIAHAGYIAVGVAAAGDSGIRSVAFYLAAYVLMNIGAFAVVIALGREGAHNEELDRFSGLAKKHPWLAGAMMIFMLSLAGIPLTAGFLGKLYLFSAAVQANLVWLAAIGMLNAVVSAYFYLRVVAKMFLAAPPDDVEARVTVPLGVSIALAAIGTIALGVYPGPLLNLIKSAMEVLTGA
jgi:NADH-quinone oxidoreductase subunit N